MRVGCGAKGSQYCPRVPAGESQRLGLVEEDQGRTLGAGFGAGFALGWARGNLRGAGRQRKRLRGTWGTVSLDEGRLGAAGQSYSPETLEATSAQAARATFRFYGGKRFVNNENAALPSGCCSSVRSSEALGAQLLGGLSPGAGVMGHLLTPPA